MDIKLIPLTEDDREQFILDNQEAFNYGALEEFGCRDDHFEEDENIISRKTIEDSIDVVITNRDTGVNIIMETPYGNAIII